MVHMKKFLTCAMVCLTAGSLLAQAEKLLMDFGAGFDPARALSGNGLTYEMALEGAVKIKVTPNGGWPGLNVALPDNCHDLSDFGGISIEAYNPEKVAQFVALRVDNPGADGAKFCNTQGYEIGPGERKTLSTWFGFTDEKPGFPLDPAKVVGFCVFWSQPKTEMALVIDNVKAIPPKPGMMTMAKPRERVQINFEDDEPMFSLRGGTLVTGAEAVAGKRSLMVDTMADAKGWFEFWESRAGLLAGSFTYTVKFQYRVIDAAEDATFYSLFRSQGKGWGKWDRGWTNIQELPVKKGKTLTQELTVSLPRFKDYMLMFGVNGRAKIVIDNIDITRGAAYNDGDLLDRAKEKRNAKAEPVVMVDFENALPEGTQIAIGEISDKPEEALMGKKSLVIDTIGRGQTWNEAVTIGRGKLEPGYKYYVTVPIRMDKKGDRGGSVYVVANPTKQVEGYDKRGWRSWNSGIGEDDVITTTFDFRKDAGYELLIGVNEEARVVIDEVEIRREALPEDRLALAKVRDKAKSKLVFEDNFDGKVIDTKKWNITGDMPRTGGIWRKANSTLDGKGNLDLLFKPDGDTFSFGAIDTKDKFNFTYGLVECRMMLPKHTGHWPGFWLFGNEVTRVGDDGRDGTEVDIVEAPWRFEEKVSHCLHWDGYGDDHASHGFTPTIAGINEGWHTYAVDWSPDGYIFLVDGVETWRSDAGGVCRNPLWVIFSDEMGGWSGNPREVDPKLLPDHILVDYVRVWQ